MRVLDCKYNIRGKSCNELVPQRSSPNSGHLFVFSSNCTFLSISRTIDEKVAIKAKRPIDGNVAVNDLKVSPNSFTSLFIC